MPGSPPKSQPLPWHLIGILLLLSMGIGITGYLYYQNLKNQIRQKQYDDLSAIAELKIKQIEQWRWERLADAAFTSNNHTIAIMAQKWLKNQASLPLKNELYNWMDLLRRSYDYAEVFLIDVGGKIQLSIADEVESMDPYIAALVGEAVQTKKVIFSDLYRGKNDQTIRLDILAPLYTTQGQNYQVVGVFLMRIDPHKLLYPLIQSWPTPSQTGETILVRHEGNDLLFLNNLRHRPNSALSLRLPVSEPKLLAALAVRGQEGVYEGIDYQGAPVIGVLKAVPHFPWFLINKMSSEEIYGPIRSQAWFIFILTMSLITAAGIGVGFIWRHRQATFYRKQYESELEKMELVQRYEHLTMFANDIILMIDLDGKVMDANERAVTAYGYSRDELLRLRIEELRAPETRPTLSTEMQYVQEQNGFIFETLHLRKDGTIFPVEVSSRLIEVEGRQVYQGIIRDITRTQESRRIKRPTGSSVGPGPEDGSGGKVGGWDSP